MRAGEPLPGAQFRQHSFHILKRAAHPFQLRVCKTFFDERRPHLVIGKNRAVVPLGVFVDLDTVILDRRRLELLPHPLLHVACGLPDFKQTVMRLVVDRIGVDAGTSLRLRPENLLYGGVSRHQSCWLDPLDGLSFQ